MLTYVAIFNLRFERQCCVSKTLVYFITDTPKSITVTITTGTTNTKQTNIDRFGRFKLILKEIVAVSNCKVFLVKDSWITALQQIHLLKRWTSTKHLSQTIKKRP